jgi:hypothetical protein
MSKLLQLGIAMSLAACGAHKPLPMPPGHDAGGDGANMIGLPPPPPLSDGGAVTASKRGVAYGFQSAADLNAFGRSVSWWYNWSSKPNAGAAGATAEFVPMVWGGNFDVAKLEAEIPAGTRFLLGFNEPNFGSQSNLTPEAAAALWPQLEQVATARGLALVSPALNFCGGSCNETDPFVWLDKFFAACSGCRVDYVAAHWYACSKSALTWYLGKYESKYTQPLWVTEFSCLDNATITDALEAQYLQDALSVLESDPRVFRYSWFTGRFSSKPVIDLLAGTGQLTSLGQSYVAFPAAQ